MGALRNSVTAETAQLADLYRDLSAFDSNEARALRTQLGKYIDVVIQDEWDALRRGGVSEKAILLFQELEFAILALETTTPRQKKLHERLLADIDAVSGSRTTRLVRGATGTPVFLYVAGLGFLWTLALLGVYAPKSRALAFLGLYCAFFGIVIYFILALGTYFEGIGGVTPEPLKFLSQYMKRS